MSSDRINARLPQPLAQHVQRVVGTHGFYETPSEYIRALIRQDMENETYKVFTQIVEGFKDIAKGRYLESSGNWEEDKARFTEQRKNNWK